MAAALAVSGYEVTLLLRPESVASYPAKLSLQSPFGKFEVSIGRAAALAEPVDCVWITVKATQLESALRSLGDGSLTKVVVPLLNGIDHVARLRDLFGADKVVAATIAVESERTASGVIVHHSPFARLNMGANGQQPLGEAAKKLTDFGFTCQFLAYENTLLWSKLAFLAPLALTTTAKGGTTSDVMSDPQWNARLEGCVAEVSRVAQACRANVDGDAIMKAIRALPNGMRSSMQKDVAAGREPELIAIAGPILREGMARNVPVPVTRELVELVREQARKTVLES